MADRKLSATISIGGSVDSSLGKAFGSVTKGAKGISNELKAIGKETKELEKMVKELKAAGKETAELEKKLSGLYKRQALLQGKRGRLGAVGGMLSSGGGLQFGAIGSAIIKKMVTSETFGAGTVAALLGAEAVIPVIGEIAMAVTVLVGAALAGAAAIFGLGKSAGDFIDNMSDTADGLGMATNNLMGLQYAAAQSGIEADAFNLKMAKMTNALESAKAGTGPAADALNELGLSWQELSVMAPEEQVQALAEAFKNYNGNIPKVSLASVFFGKGSAKFVNLLNQGRDGIRKQMQDSRAVGYMVTKDQEEMAGRFDKAWNTTLISFKAAWLQIGTSVLPVVNDYLGQIVAWFKDPASQEAIKGFAKDFGQLVKSLAESLPTVVTMLNGVLKAVNGIVTGVQTIYNLGGGEGVFGLMTGNPIIVGSAIGKKQMQTGGAGFGGKDGIIGGALSASVGVGRWMLGYGNDEQTSNAGAKTDRQPTAKPAAASGQTIQNHVNVTVQGHVMTNQDLTEYIHRSLRDLTPQQMGNYAQ